MERTLEQPRGIHYLRRGDGVRRRLSFSGLLGTGTPEDPFILEEENTESTPGNTQWETLPGYTLLLERLSLYGAATNRRYEDLLLLTNEAITRLAGLEERIAEVKRAIESLDEGWTTEEDDS